MADVKIVQKKKYKKITTYVGEDGKTHRITEATKLYTKKGGFKSEAIKALAKAKSISEFELQEQIKYNLSNKNKVSVLSILTSYSGNKVQRFLGNFGIDVNEFANDLKLECPEVDLAWILNENHWTSKGVYKIDGPLMLPDGRSVEFLWDYEEGAIYQIIGTRNITSEDID